MDNLHIVGVFGAPLPIVDVWPVSCFLVYDGTAAGTVTSPVLVLFEVGGRESYVDVI